MIRLLLAALFLFSKVCALDPVENRLSHHIHYSSTGDNLIGYLHLSKDSPISEASYLYVKMALEEFKRRGVCFVALDLDTPGGEVFASVKISQLLKKLDLEDHIPVVAFVNNWALSAGALLAYSCRFIGATEDALMGAAEPVTISEGKMESASEKITSALRAEFASTASLFDRDPLIAEAMVDKEIILVQRKGKIVRLNDESEVIKGKDLLISAKGKLLTLTSPQMKEFAVADFILPYTPLEKSSQAKGATSPFSSYLLSNESFLHKIPNAYLISYHSAKISFFSFLAHPMISSLLMLGLIAGIYLEMQSPGFGLFGAIALVCLSLIILSSMAEGAIGYLDVIALITGILLVFVEIFVTPGLWLAGAIGVVLILGSAISMLLPAAEGINLPWGEIVSGGYSMMQRIAILLFGCLLAASFAAFFSRTFLMRTKFYSKMILKDVGGRASEGEDLTCLIGEKGAAETSLRPCGKVLIRGRIYNASAESLYIEKASAVVVRRVEGQMIFVEPSPLV